MKALEETTNDTPVKWNEKTKECEFKINLNLEARFPCLRFIEERLKLLEEKKVGVFVWEGG